MVILGIYGIEMNFGWVFLDIVDGQCFSNFKSNFASGIIKKLPASFRPKGNIVLCLKMSYVFLAIIANRQGLLGIQCPVVQLDIFLDGAMQVKDGRFFPGNQRFIQMWDTIVLLLCQNVALERRR